MGSFGIDLVAHGLVRLIRRTELNSVCTRERAITRVTHGRTGLQTYTEGFSFGMEFLCALCQGKRHCLGHSGSGKTTEAQDVTMLYQFSGLFR
jgi:hypothetical protein